MKLFSTSNIIKGCQSYFNLKLPSELLTKRYDKFLLKLSTTKCILCGFRLNSADAILVVLNSRHSRVMHMGFDGSYRVRPPFRLKGV